MSRKIILKLPELDRVTSSYTHRTVDVLYQRLFTWRGWLLRQMSRVTPVELRIHDIETGHYYDISIEKGQVGEKRV